MILMNDFKAEPPEIREAMYAAVKRVLDSGWFILGKELEEFELCWASTCGTDYAVGVGNGMDAIEIILRSLGIGPEDEVITTGMTAFATVLAIARAGATPVLADIDPETGLMCRKSARNCFTPKTKAIILVHLYGQVRDMASWVALSQDLGVKLIEDCAQAHLAQADGTVAGAFGVAGAYSFYPTKNLGAIGDAGAIVSSDEQLIDTAQRLRNYGQSLRYHHPDLGMNSRMDELQAALLSVRIRWLKPFTDRRQEIAETYFTNISNSRISFLAVPQNPCAHAYHLFVIKCEQRNKLQEFLSKNGVQTLIHYPIPIHQQISMTSISRDPSGLKRTEHFANTCLSLPCHPQMSDEDVAKVVKLVNDFPG